MYEWRALKIIVAHFILINVKRTTCVKKMEKIERKDLSLSLFCSEEEKYCGRLADNIVRCFRV